MSESPRTSRRTLRQLYGRRHATGADEDPPAPSIDNQRYCAAIIERINALPSLKTQPMRAIRRDLSRMLKSAPARDVIQLAKRLIAQEPRFRWLAYELIYHH